MTSALLQIIGDFFFLAEGDFFLCHFFFAEGEKNFRDFFPYGVGDPPPRGGPETHYWMGMENFGAGYPVTLNPPPLVWALGGRFYPMGPVPMG